jgi:hypothetical protein
MRGSSASLLSLAGLQVKRKSKQSQAKEQQEAKPENLFDVGNEVVAMQQQHVDVGPRGSCKSNHTTARSNAGDKQ